MPMMITSLRPRQSHSMWFMMMAMILLVLGVGSTTTMVSALKLRPLKTVSDSPFEKFAPSTHHREAPYVRRLIIDDTAPSSGILNGNPGVDRPGGNMPGMPIQLKSGAVPSDCANLCLSTSGCVAWSYGQGSCNTTDANPTCWLKSEITSLVLNSCNVAGVAHAGLSAPVFPRLPASAIQVHGWLDRQMQIQASGLFGHLHLFWVDVENSSWIGGNGDNGGERERMPYWLNGMVANAYISNHADLIAAVGNFISYIIEHQTKDGFMGPLDGFDPWPRFPVLMAFQQYAELNPSDARVIPAMYNYLEYLLKQMLTPGFKFTDYIWAYTRSQDLLVSIYWLYDNHPMGREQFLLDLAELVFTTGYDWKLYYRKTIPHDGSHYWGYFDHGVNNGMAMKAAALWFRQSHDQDDVDSTYQRVEVLDLYHGQASGVFSCDEVLAGLNPSRGTELCTVVESMYSYSTMMSILGDPYFGDRTERAAFNALPATVTADSWAHQYLQQSNQINTFPNEHPWWNSDGSWSGVFGLAPNYGCCTVNYGQGWTKYVTNMYMMTQTLTTTGIFAALLGPSSVSVVLQDPTYGDNAVSIVQETDYPFGLKPVIDFTIEADHPFPFSIRIPGWSVGATVRMPDGSIVPAQNGTVFVYHYNPIGKGMPPSGIAQIKVTLPYHFEVSHRLNNSVSLYYGPFLMALDLNYTTTVLNTYEFNSKDYGYLVDTEWRYGVLLDESKPDFGFTISEAPIPPMPFDPTLPPLIMTVYGRVIDWPMQHNGTAPPPLSPVSSSKPLEPLTFVPFGTSKMRIAQLPYLES